MEIGSIFSHVENIPDVLTGKDINYKSKPILRIRETFNKHSSANKCVIPLNFYPQRDNISSEELFHFSLLWECKISREGAVTSNNSKYIIHKGTMPIRDEIKIAPGLYSGFPLMDIQSDSWEHIVKTNCDFIELCMKDLKIPHINILLLQIDPYLPVGKARFSDSAEDVFYKHVSKTIEDTFGVKFCTLCVGCRSHGEVNELPGNPLLRRAIPSTIDYSTGFRYLMYYWFFYGSGRFEPNYIIDYSINSGDDFNDISRIKEWLKN